MDRSFLSNEQVIEASRNFVCLRLATYEDANEAKFLEKIYTRGNGLENTVFAILTPDGSENLTRPGRRPSFRRASQMAQAMNEIVEKDYGHSSKKLWSDKTLPEMKSLELALNVASCDGLPVVLTLGKSSSDIHESKEQLLPVAWHNDFAGQFVFASATSDDDLRAIQGLPKDQREGVYIIAPDAFGLSGKVLTKLSGQSPDTVQIRTTLADFKPPAKNHRQHVQTGFQLGLKWETAIPVTDREAARAAARLWSKE